MSESDDEEEARPVGGIEAGPVPVEACRVTPKRGAIFEGAGQLGRERGLAHVQLAYVLLPATEEMLRRRCVRHCDDRTRSRQAELVRESNVSGIDFVLYGEVAGLIRPAPLVAPLARLQEDMALDA